MLPKNNISLNSGDIWCSGLCSWQDFLIMVHEKVIRSNKYNFEGCRIKVNNKMNIEFFRHMLADYKDFQVCELLEYGFPLGCTNADLSLTYSTKCRNHKGARDFPNEVREYLESEVFNGSVLGPFKKIPFNSGVILSPLNTVPKKDSVERRIILDCSFPKGHALNDVIAKDEYLEEKVNLVYPKVDDLVELIKIKGQGCWLFKKDLRKAYRQIFIDPGEYHKVGYKFQNHLYFDSVLSMGLRSSAQICQRVTNAITYMMFKIGVSILNYLDDLAGAEKKDRVDIAYQLLESILAKLGISESTDKACPPATRMLFVGVLFDTVKMTLEICPGRLQEIQVLVSEWLKKSNASRKELQSLLGKLSFVSSCVRPGRIFVQRLLTFLRSIFSQPEQRFTLPEYIKGDLRWWQVYLPKYNGVSMMFIENWSQPDEILATDSCLNGCGGVLGSEYFHSKFPSFIQEQNLHINALELLTIVVALKVWGSKLRGRRIMVLCDNISSCLVLNKGITRCQFMQTCLREICYLSAVFEFEIRAKHIKGVENRLPDLLSRWDLHQKYQTEFMEVFVGQEVHITDDQFKMFDYW